MISALVILIFFIEIGTCSEWEEWSPCSATCNGMQTRIHHCKNDTHESDELQARPCNTMPCKLNFLTRGLAQKMISS